MNTLNNLLFISRITLLCLLSSCSDPKFDLQVPKPAKDFDFVGSLYPEEPVKIGNTWEVSAEGLQRLFGATDALDFEGTLYCTLARVRKAGSVNKAEVAFHGNISYVSLTSSNGELQIKASLEGVSVLNLDNGLESTELSGSIQFSDVASQRQGSGRIEVTEQETLLTR